MSSDFIFVFAEYKESGRIIKIPESSITIELFKNTSNVFFNS